MSCGKPNPSAKRSQCGTRQAFAGRYEKLKRFPKGFLTFGDSICSFNPLYGQGMSVAATEARALGEELAYGHDRIAQRFFKKAAKIVDIAWDTAVSNDLKMPETPGHRSLKVRLVNWYVAKLHKLAHTDGDATVGFIRVAQLLAPPESLMKPSMMLRVLNNEIRRLLDSASPQRVRETRTIREARANLN